jgi:hypothetical protein
MNLAPVKTAAERESLDPYAAGRLIHRARRSAKLRVLPRLPAGFRSETVQ